MTPSSSARAAHGLRRPVSAVERCGVGLAHLQQIPRSAPTKRSDEYRGIPPPSGLPADGAMVGPGSVAPATRAPRRPAARAQRQVGQAPRADVEGRDPSERRGPRPSQSGRSPGALGGGLEGSLELPAPSGAAAGGTDGRRRTAESRPRPPVAVDVVACAACSRGRGCVGVMDSCWAARAHRRGPRGMAAGVDIQRHGTAHRRSAHAGMVDRSRIAPRSASAIPDRRSRGSSAGPVLRFQCRRSIHLGRRPRRDVQADRAVQAGDDYHAAAHGRGISSADLGDLGSRTSADMVARSPRITLARE